MLPLVGIGLTELLNFTPSTLANNSSESCLGAKSISVFVYDNHFRSVRSSEKLRSCARNSNYMNHSRILTWCILLDRFKYCKVHWVCPERSYLATLLVDETTASALGLLSLTNNTQTLHMILG